LGAVSATLRRAGSWYIPECRCPSPSTGRCPGGRGDDDDDGGRARARAAAAGLLLWLPLLAGGCLPARVAGRLLLGGAPRRWELACSCEPAG
jgi:hypothetical protein